MGNPQKITDRKRINLYLSHGVVADIEGLLKDRESVSSVTEGLLREEIGKRLPVMAQARPSSKRIKITHQPGAGHAAPQASKRNSA